jgi:hypothetical protein
MGLTHSYSHAAPFIRQQLCYAVNHAENARTQKGRREGFATAHGLAKALEILRVSEDYSFTDGIAEREALPPQAVEQTIRFLGSSAHEILGIPHRRPTIRCVWCRQEIEPAVCSWCGAPLTTIDENGDLLGEAACHDDDGHTDSGRQFWIHTSPVDDEHPRQCDRRRNGPYQGEYATTQGQMAASFTMPTIPAVEQ